MNEKKKIIIDDIIQIYKGISRENYILKNKKILLLGSNGFLGKYFVGLFEYILNKGFITFQVDCYDNYISSKKNKKKKIKNINFYNKDITKIDIKKKYDIIIFLAGIASPYFYKKFPIQTIDVSYFGLKKMLNKAKKDKSKLIFFSSSEIYGNPDKKNIPTKESYYGNVNSFGPRSCYDEGKRIGETLCYIYKNYYKTKISIIRPFNVFGPLMDRNDYRVIPNFIKKIKSNKMLHVHGDGRQTRTFCYITDAMVGFMKVILRKESIGEIYNIGNPNNELNMLNLCKIFKLLTKKKLKVKKIKYPSHYPGDEPMRRCPDISKAKKIIKFFPKTNLKIGIKKLLVFNNII